MKGSTYPYISFAKRLLTDRKFLVCTSLATIFLLSIPTPVQAQSVDDIPFINGDIPFIDVPGFGDAIGYLADQLLNAAGAFVAAYLVYTFFFLSLAGYMVLVFCTTLAQITLALALSISYTPLGAVAGEEGIANMLFVAWSLMRDLANSLFILILIAIGLGTMLGIEVRGKKINAELLVRFVGIAVLINFTPLLAGILIDISHILTKFFFAAGVGGLDGFITNNPFIKMLNNFKPQIITDVKVSASFAIEFIVGFIFNLSASFVLAVMALLLMMRILAIWLLVILSPLAFALSILPQTNPYFEKWWKQFLHWTFLPIPFGLFLWLAGLILTRGSAACGGVEFTNFSGVGLEETNDITAATNNLLNGGQFCEAMMIFLALGAVVVGMFVAFSSSAMGASLVIKQATKFRRYATRQGKQYVGGRVARNVRDGGPVRTPGFGNGRFRQRKLATIPGVQNVPNRMIEKGGGLPIIGGAVITAASGLQGALNKTTKTEMDVERGRIKNLSDKQAQETLKRTNDPRLIAALTERVSKDDNEAFSEIVGSKKALRDVVDNLIIASKTNQELGKIFKDVLKKNVQLTENPAETITGLSVKDREQLPATALRSPGVIKALEDNNLLTDKFFNSIAKNPKRAAGFADGYLQLLTNEGELQEVMGVPVIPDNTAMDAILQKRAAERKDTPIITKTLSSHPILAAASRTARGETADEADERKNLEARDAGAAAAREQQDSQKNDNPPAI